MWTKLVDLILQWWKDKPRNDLIRELIHLRDSMQNCQQRYEKLQLMKKAGKVYHLPYSNSQDEWIRSVETLGSVIREVDQVLSIFSPEARQAIEKYHKYEIKTVDWAIAATAEALGDEVTDFDMEQEILGPDFKAALDALDSFIRATFKAEEIHAANTSRFA